jgi:hypothetical protein
MDIDSSHTKGKTMRLIILLSLALCACSSPQLRCDKHLLPINAPAAKDPGAKDTGAKDTAARDSAASAGSRP